MHVFTLFPHIIVFVIMCANSCKWVSYSKACYLGEFLDVENWLGNVRMHNGYIFVLFDLILYVHSTIFQLCGTGLPGLNQY